MMSKTLEAIARTVLFKLLDLVIPVLVEALANTGDAIEQYAQEKADKLKEKLKDKLSPEELKNEVNDLGKLIKKIF